MAYDEEFVSFTNLYNHQKTSAMIISIAGRKMVSFANLRIGNEDFERIYERFKQEDG